MSCLCSSLTDAAWNSPQLAGARIDIPVGRKARQGVICTAVLCLREDSDINKRYDVIIIGSGSAGGVLASRLTEDPDTRVLVLEAGPADRSIMIHMPAAFSYPLGNDRYNWAYYCEPDPHMDNRRVYCPRGRVIGGSSSINGMVYIRGNARDYDGWQASGANGWAYRDVLPYFRKAETRLKGGDEYRGDSGPLKVTTGACDNTLFNTFINAGKQAGYPYTADMNGYQQEGLGPMDMTTFKGERWSVANGYLRPAMVRPNLEVRLKSLVTRIRFARNQAIGVECVHKGNLEKVDAGEVILCGGAINSPQLLNLSGIGDGKKLKQFGIEVRVELPGVGRNLQDHLEVYVQHSCTQPVSIYPATRPLTKLKIGLQWLLTRGGWGASNQFESGGFIRSRTGVEYPDLQFHFLPIAINYDGRSPAGGHGFQAHTGPMRPSSRGSVELRSADPADPPKILFNYTATEHDRQVMRDGIRHTREIFAQSAFDDLRGPELAPGREAESDAALDAFVRDRGESAYHPSCTCKIGTDEQSVVDANGKLHGATGLRVVDASIMPNIINGNLNATVIMMAEKLADTIRGREALPPSDAPVYASPNWETHQR